MPGTNVLGPQQLAVKEGRKFFQALGKRTRLFARKQPQTAPTKKPQPIAAQELSTDKMESGSHIVNRDPNDTYSQAVGQTKTADPIKSADDAKPTVQVKRTDAVPKKKSLFRRLFTTKTFALTLGTTVACVAVAGIVSACLPTPLGPVALVILGVMIFSGIGTGIYLSHKWEKEGLEEGHARKGNENQVNPSGQDESVEKDQAQDKKEKEATKAAQDNPVLEINQTPPPAIKVTKGPDQSQLAAQGTDRSEKERQKQAGDGLHLKRNKSDTK